MGTRELSDGLVTLVRKSKGSDIVVIAGDFNAQFEKLSKASVDDKP